MRTVFMGSPDFAVACLQALAAATEVVAVVSQPDKPAGRGQKVLAPAVKLAALDRGLPVLQPPSVRPGRSNFVEELRALAPDLVVVVAYGKILPPEVLAVPRQGCWNIHASLLPRYRGAAPIQWALIRGEERTGVTLMQMDAGMDTGPVYLGDQLPIEPDDTGRSLHEKLSALGAGLLTRGLSRLLRGDLSPPLPQDPAGATRAPMLDKEHGRADFTRNARAVSCQLRGVDPWPGAFTTLTLAGASGPAGAAEAARPEDEVVLKLFRPKLSSGSGRPGQVLGVDREGLHVACGDGAVAIAELQLPARKRMPAQALLSGHPIPPGTILGKGQPNPRLDD